MAVNTSSNISDVQFPPLQFTPTLIVFITLQQITFVLACVGNSAVIFVSIKYITLKTISNRVVVSLAVSDFLTGIASGLQIFYFFFDSMNTNKVACFTRYRIVATTTIASLLHVTLTTFDRYVAICHPHDYKTVMSDKLANILIAFCWLYALLIGLLPYFWIEQLGWRLFVPLFLPCALHAQRVPCRCLYRLHTYGSDLYFIRDDSKNCLAFHEEGPSCNGDRRTKAQ